MQIAFYDQIFNAIADNGWAADSQVTDSNYLNQMLQNNMYTITTMEQCTDDEGDDYFEYDTHIASNFKHIISVNDNAAQELALAEYEYEKNIINEKESRIDTRMKDLETEQSAIVEMIKSIESVKDENIERHMNVMS